MASEWQCLPFNEAVEINPPVSLEPGHIYPFVDMQAVEPHSRTVRPSEYREFKGSGSRFADGDTLMARITPCLENGKIARFHSDGQHRLGFGSTEFIVIRGRAGVTNNDFAYYLTCWDYVRQYAISQMTGTSGRQRVPVSAFSHLEVPVPPLSEQRAIAHILGTLDEKIELLRRMNETLEAMARALFKSWFVDFDPVIDNALEAGNPIPDELKEKAKRRLALGERRKLLPEHIRRLFPDRFVDSELGPIPDGWKVKHLRDITTKPQYGYTASASDTPVGPKFLRITDINKMAWIDWATVPFCQISDEDYAKYRLAPGDVLIARMADPGHGVVIEENVEAVFASYLIRFRLLDVIYDRYIQYWLRSSKYWELVNTRKSGTTRSSLNAKEINKFPLLVPPRPVAAVFRDKVDSLRRLIVLNTAEINVLAAIRDTLLPKLVSGVIRVDNTAKLLETKKIHGP